MHCASCSGGKIMERTCIDYDWLITLSVTRQRDRKVTSSCLQTSVATAAAARSLRESGDVRSRDSTVYGGLTYGFSIKASSAKPPGDSSSE